MSQMYIHFEVKKKVSGWVDGNKRESFEVSESQSATASAFKIFEEFNLSIKRHNYLHYFL